MTTSSNEFFGLHLLDSDEITAEEMEVFRAQYEKKGLNKSYEFWLEFRPDVVKRHKARTAQWNLGSVGCVPSLAPLHQYIIQGFSDGIQYEIIGAQSTGALKTDIIDVMSVAFIHSGHPGMFAAAKQVTELFREYENIEGPRFPAGWEFDPGAFRSGMDFSSLRASKEDIASLEGWYEETIGMVPRHVTLLAEYRPDLLKAYRNRYEHTIRDSLPKQMMPYLMIHYNVYRGFADAIRENILLARAFGVTKEQVLNAIFSAVLHSGANALDIVDTAAADLLATFPEQ